MTSELEFIRIEDPIREEMTDEGAVAAAVEYGGPWHMMATPLSRAIRYLLVSRSMKWVNFP